LLQDTCQALGATIDGRPIGALGDASVLSFGGSKVISAGRGGAWTTNDPVIAQRARVAAGAGSGAYELSELQATAVLAQLPFLPRITEQCRMFFAQQANILAELCPNLEAPWLAEVDQTAFYQAGWILREAFAVESKEERKGESSAQPSASRKSIPWAEISQSQHAEHERVRIGGGFPGYHRRSLRRCRIDRPLRNTAIIADTTLTVHYRAALNELPVADLIAQLFNYKASKTH
jgi:perosamine synthetase